MKFLFGYKPLVDERVERFLRKKEKELSRVNHWGSDVIGRLLPFVTAGKTVRGCLVAYTYTLLKSSAPSFIYDTAAAVELFQAGLLIHDDIMDNDATRRGLPSIHTQYDRLAKSKHFGISMGISAGDFCFFLGYSLLPPSIIPTVSRELSRVCVAQMQDESGGFLTKKFTKEDTVSLYRYKTARYSFSLPMMIGAQLAGADEKTIRELETLGESMGILFQLRDDELGRSVESDARNNKQTLLSLLTPLEYSSYQSTLITQATECIGNLQITKPHKDELVSLVAFCHNRAR